MFDWFYPYVFTNCEPSKASMRCRVIERELGRHCINGNVSRHTLFRVEYYIVRVSDNKIDGMAIASALNIPKDWVCLYHCRSGENTYYAIPERKLNDKYLNYLTGNLVFDKPFNLKKYFKDHDIDDFKCKFQSMMGVELSDWVYDNETDTVLFRVLNELCSFDRQRICNVLNIPYEWIGAFYMPNDEEWVYTLWLGDVR